MSWADLKNVGRRGNYVHTRTHTHSRPRYRRSSVPSDLALFVLRFADATLDKTASAESAQHSVDSRADGEGWGEGCGLEISDL